MKTGLTILGVALILYGLHWIGQGTGLLMWPAGTIMDNNSTFTWLGALVAAAGAGLIVFAQRR